MPETGGFNEAIKLNSAEAELAFLREEVRKKEMALKEAGQTANRESIISDKIVQYKKSPAELVLAREHAILPKETETIVLDLSPEEHDKKIEQLVAILITKGVKNTLSVIHKLNDAHIDDDFHRFLVQYIKAGFEVKDIKAKSQLSKLLHTTLYEVALPETSDEDKDKELKQLISGMEQFYAGMLSASMGSRGTDQSFSIEMANANGSKAVIFYVSVPDDKQDLFEKQIFSIFHNAKIREVKDDYNIFNGQGASAASYGRSQNNPIFPLKTYEQFDIDPLNVILNSFSKITKDGEGAAVQFVFNLSEDKYNKRYKYALDEINRGKSIRKAIDIPESLWGSLFKTLKEVTSTDKPKNKDQGARPIDETTVKGITDKIASPILDCNIRIVSSAASADRAESILSDLEASFNQFQSGHGNKLDFKKVKGRALRHFLRQFSFRMFMAEQKIPLNIKELTTLVHFPKASIKSSPQLKQSKAGTSPAPTDLPKEGVLLGVNRDRNTDTKVYITSEDRLRHFYIIGQTGTGKTTLLKNMIVQDILRGEGVCMIDPHGVDIDDVLAMVPKERYDDLIYFDPSYTQRPMALNMLEYDTNFPEQKTFVVNELFSIFQKLYGKVPESMGPMFEQYFRNATMLVIEDPDSGNTLLDVSRVMSVKTFRDMKVSRCKNPVVVQFWREIAEKAGGEGALQNMVPYITSKFDVFLANDIMRPIIAQKNSSFNFRQIMDQKKILLVNLSKGRLGDINSSLIGLILVGKILMAALSRVDSFGKEMYPFYLYIDEFQNVTTNSIATILSEARKYKLGLTIAHQFIAQLEEDIKDAVFGNVGSIATFRVGAEDAEYLEKQFGPTFTARDIMNVDNRNAYLKLLVEGKPVKPFNIETVAPQKGNPETVAALKQLSYLKYGRDRAEVEAEILVKYQSR